MYRNIQTSPAIVKCINLTNLFHFSIYSVGEGGLSTCVQKQSVRSLHNKYFINQLVMQWKSGVIQGLELWLYIFWKGSTILCVHKL